MNPMLRLTIRDARRHWFRTGLATLLVALPIAAMLSFIGITSPKVTGKDAALARIPAQVQALLTATAIRSEVPLRQPPEGIAMWMDDSETLPARTQILARELPSQDRLLPKWHMDHLIATTAIRLTPGETVKASAGDSLPIANTDDLASVSINEAEDEALRLLLPNADTLPANAEEAVVTAELAEKLRVKVGDLMTLVAPPSTGWKSTDGRIQEVVQDQMRGYRIVGLVSEPGLEIWTGTGWLAKLVTADGLGVSRHYLVVGDEPITWEQVKLVNTHQAFIVSRHVLENYPSASERYPVQLDTRLVLMQVFTLILGGLAAVGLLLCLVTPAFTVSVEQSRRVFGLSLATGATGRHLGQMMLWQGLIVGGAGGLLGVAVS